MDYMKDKRIAAAVIKLAPNKKIDDIVFDAILHGLFCFMLDQSDEEKNQGNCT